MSVDGARLMREPKLRRARQLLLGRTVLELAVIMLHSIFADYTSTKLGWDARSNGFAMGASGLLSVGVDLVLLPQLHKRLLGEVNMVFFGSTLSASGLLAAAISATAHGFMLALALVALGSAMFKSAAAALILNASAREQVGSISGAVDALEAACRVCAPLAAGWLLDAVHVEAPVLAAAVLCMLGAIVVLEAPPMPTSSTLAPRSKPE